MKLVTSIPIKSGKIVDFTTFFCWKGVTSFNARVKVKIHLGEWSPWQREERWKRVKPAILMKCKGVLHDLHHGGIIFYRLWKNNMFVLSIEFSSFNYSASKTTYLKRQSMVCFYKLYYNIHRTRIIKSKFVNWETRYSILTHDRKNRVWPWISIAKH